MIDRDTSADSETPQGDTEKYPNRVSLARQEAREELRSSDDHEDPEQQHPHPHPHPHPPADPPTAAAIRPPSKHSNPFSHHVIALLAPFAMLGLLARLGLEALTDYNGNSVFALAWVQGVGCFVMGIAAGLREPISQLCVIINHGMLYEQLCPY